MTAAALLPANAFDWPRMEKFVFSRPPDPARNTPGVLINKSWVSRMEDWRSMSPLNAVTDTGDRKSVVSGKSVSVRVDLGGRRIVQTKQTHKNLTVNTRGESHS